MNGQTFSSAEDRAAAIERTAAYFTAIRGRGRSRVRHECATRAEAEAHGTGDGKTLIYAVAPNGESAHLTNV